MAAETETQPPRQASRSLLAILPLAIFGLLLVLLWFGLGGFSKEGRNPQDLTWVLQGKPVPALSLPALPGLNDAAGKPIPGLSRDDLVGHITVLNFWGSWCEPCRFEHPQLMRLATWAKARNVRIVSIDYKDSPAENPLKFLKVLGNPFTAVGVDTSGRTGIDFGVYGVPETFIIGPDAVFAEKQVGPLSEENFDAFLGKIEAVIRKHPQAVK